MEAQLISDLSAFQDLRQQWNELAANFQSPLLRHEWFASSVAAFCSQQRPLATMIVRSGKRLRAVAPLMAVRRFGVTQLQTLGAYRHAEPGGFIYDSEEALVALLTTLIRSKRSFTLFRFNPDALETRRLRELLPKSSLCISRSLNSERSLWVPLKPQWEEFEATISSRRRSDLRRYRRCAERFGQLEFNVIKPEIDTLAVHLQELFRIEASGWKGQSGMAVLSSPSSVRFFSHYAQAAAELGILRLFFLRIGGRTAATRMAVEHNNRLWDLKIGYDETLSKCAPGVLLTHETMRYAVDRRLEAYEFLGRAESWETLWPCQEHHYVSTKVYPISVSGALFGLLDGCRSVKRKASKIITQLSRGTEA